MKKVKGIAALVCFFVGVMALTVNYEALPLWAAPCGVGIFALTTYIIYKAYKRGHLDFLNKLITE